MVEDSKLTRGNPLVMSVDFHSNGGFALPILLNEPATVLLLSVA